MRRKASLVTTALTIFFFINIISFAEDSPTLQQLKLFPQDYMGQTLYFHNISLHGLDNAVVNAKDMAYYTAVIQDQHGISLGFPGDPYLMIPEQMAKDLLPYISKGFFHDAIHFMNIRVYIGHLPTIIPVVVHLEHVTLLNNKTKAEEVTFSAPEKQSSLRKLLPRGVEVWREKREIERQSIEAPKHRNIPGGPNTKASPSKKKNGGISTSKELKAPLPPISLPSAPPKLAAIPSPRSSPVQSKKASRDTQAALEQSREQTAKLTVPPPVAPLPESAPASPPASKAGPDTNAPSLQVVGGSIPYWGRVKANIVRHWVAPAVEETRRQGPLKVIVAFRIDRDGKISRVRIQQPSGNAYYDIAAQRAVVAANPLPHFPPDMPERYHDLKFQFSVVNKKEE